MIRSRRRATIINRTSCNLLRDLIDAKIEAYESYKDDTATKVDKTVSSYRRPFGIFGKNIECPDGDTIDSDDSILVFSGRTLIHDCRGVRITAGSGKYETLFP